MKIRRRLPYIEVNRGGYGRFRGIEVAVGRRSVFRCEMHLYRKGNGIAGYANCVRMG